MTEDFSHELDFNGIYLTRNPYIKKSIKKIHFSWDSCEEKNYDRDIVRERKEFQPAGLTFFPLLILLS